MIRPGDARTLCGDVEVHLRGRDWRVRGHDGDPRCRRVILHVVLTNDLQPTRLADGAAVPVLALADVELPPPLPLQSKDGGPWPCQRNATRLAERDRLGLPDQAVEVRFLEMGAALQAQLAAATHAEATSQAEQQGWSVESRLLFVALAEGLGYGREREAFRVLGAQLATLAPTLTAPAYVYEGLLAKLTAAPRLDRQRLAALTRLAERWWAADPWPQLWGTLSRIQSDNDTEVLLISGETYQVATRRSDSPVESLSEGRAAILVWSVSLPFTSGWALLHEGEALRSARTSRRWSFRACPPTRLPARCSSTCCCRSIPAWRWCSRGCIISINAGTGKRFVRRVPARGLRIEGRSPV